MRFTCPLIGTHALDLVPLMLLNAAPALSPSSLSLQPHVFHSVRACVLEQALTACTSCLQPPAPRASDASDALECSYSLFVL